MSKAVGRLETDADLILQQAVDTLVARWGQTKQQGVSGVGPIGPDQTDRHKILNICVKRMVAMSQRGAVGKYVRSTQIPAGTVALT